MNALSIRRLGHRYGLTTVLSDVSLDLKAGETLALVGPSGCGKSTLLHIVAGLLDPYEGRVRSTFGRIGCMFQQPRLMPWKNALDNIALGLKAQRVPAVARRRQALDWAARLGLSAEDGHKYPHELSGGMQSRVALGRALAVAPELLLLDEPFSALDVGLKLELYAVLREQVEQGGSAVLMITHDLMEAVRLADRIAVMGSGPGRVLHEFAVDRPRSARDEAWIHRTTAELMDVPPVRECFGLAPARPPVSPARPPALEAGA
ncbi:ABC transporter ATP-binding protein [Castellaniella defragrans]|jgi:NitT/TauT family transport system ATP-binding protein|uniref:ATPase component ABC-type transport system n=1 Tax=Castellaniella defragrans (strain DSM 12143 / CCUG 39792 / 65Phen) TaxID=1437824 RepID=W8X1T2_CASD6|nr:ABC transporter ATP-binding protein [Castellaniella defragrans]CDM26048.1 ATPase component ABC-type transport system [Castellaniella defragrans 65Phen]